MRIPDHLTCLLRNLYAGKKQQLELDMEQHTSTANTLSNNTREDSTHGHHQMVNTEIRLIIFFDTKDGEALYNQQKDRELTVAQIMNQIQT